jgi:hypothetical protein
MMNMARANLVAAEKAASSDYPATPHDCGDFLLNADSILKNEYDAVRLHRCSEELREPMIFCGLESDNHRIRRWERFRSAIDVNMGKDEVAVL